MDWKRLVQFALLGRSDLEQYAISLVRVSLGLFFAISGANKLFVASPFTTISARRWHRRASALDDEPNRPKFTVAGQLPMARLPGP